MVDVVWNVLGSAFHSLHKVLRMQGMKNPKIALAGIDLLKFLNGSPLDVKYDCILQIRNLVIGIEGAVSNNISEPNTD